LLNNLDFLVSTGPSEMSNVFRFVLCPSCGFLGAVNFTIST